jgi:hypothetical protein
MADFSLRHQLVSYWRYDCAKRSPIPICRIEESGRSFALSLLGLLATALLSRSSDGDRVCREVNFVEKCLSPEFHPYFWKPMSCLIVGTYL